jgi:photosystem II stability/assembly factor-like uncharacterized protein
MTSIRRITITGILFLNVFPILLHSQPLTSVRFSPGIASQLADRRVLIQQMVNSVSRENIVKNIAGLQAFGNRYEYGSQQEAAADWIIKELGWWGVTAESDPYKIGISSFSGLDMLTKDTAWVVGINGIMLFTGNGARSWTKITTPLSGTSSALQAVEFIDSRNGWVAGASAYIFCTSDGGKSWWNQTPGSQYSFTDIQFANARLGVAVGGGKQIYRTTNGGLVWSRVHLDPPNTLRRVRILDTLNMWAVGDNGTILRSNDGGANWAPQASGVTTALYSIHFVNANVGWAAGIGSTLLQTTDGGQSWRPVTEVSKQFPGVTFFDITFADASNGWISCSYSKVLRTSDGGHSWASSNPTGKEGSWASLFRIAQIGGTHLLSCGTYSTIVLSTDRGRLWESQSVTMPSELFHPSRNIVVTIPGARTPEKEYLMIAHYDGTSAGPGADDNASGTSALMEAARILKNCQFESTIRLIAVSAEEVGLCGSSDYATRARQQGKNIGGVLNADMIGYPLTGDTTRLVAGSYFVHCRLADSVFLYNQRYSIGAKVDLSDSCSGSDHTSFAAAGYEAISIQEGASTEIWARKNPYYHLASDSLSKLHPGLMRRAAQLLVATIAELAGPISQTGIPQVYALDQNYPNPFNAGTMITFGLPQPSVVKLKVYDMLGMQVASLYDGRAEAGLHRIAWLPAGLSSGVYFYRLQTAGYSETRKLILIK